MGRAHNQVSSTYNIGPSHTAAVTPRLLMVADILIILTRVITASRDRDVLITAASLAVKEGCYANVLITAASLAVKEGCYAN